MQHRNSVVCGVDRGIAAVVFFAHGELWIETNGNVTRMSGVPGWSRAVILPHQREMSPSFCTQRRQFEFLPPWWLALGAPVGCFARRPATESATKSMRVIRLADGAVAIAKCKKPDPRRPRRGPPQKPTLPPPCAGSFYCFVASAESFRRIDYYVSCNVKLQHICPFVESPSGCHGLLFLRGIQFGSSHCLCRSSTCSYV